MTAPTSSSRSLPYVRAAAVWLGILAIANVNGALREFLLVALLGQTLARALSTILLCVLVAILARATIGWIGARNASEAWRVGLLWLALTLGFEFLAGHYLFGDSWEQLLREYDLAAGRIWAIVPLVTLIAPRWAWGRTTARSRGGAAMLLLAFGAGGSACADVPAANRVGSSPSHRSAHQSGGWSVRIDGAGPIAYGMSVEQARPRTGIRMARGQAAKDARSCDSATCRTACT